MTLNALWVWRYTEKVSLNNDSIHSHLHQNQSINECSRKKKVKNLDHRVSEVCLWDIKLRWDIVLDSYFDKFYSTLSTLNQNFPTTLELKYRINYYVIERSYMMLA